MRFTTASGTVYDLIDIEVPVNEDLEVIGAPFDGLIVRHGSRPIIDRWDGSEMDEILGQRVQFYIPPIIGESFHFESLSHGYVTTTPVVSIEEGEDKVCL